MVSGEDKLKLGMIGTGRIANRFVPEARMEETLHIAAVYNPRLTSAKKFAENWAIPIGTDDWTSFCAQIDVAYVASPHDTHYDYVKQLLLEGKHVLCEKPLCFSRNQAEELFCIAADGRLILMEAVKTAYCPGFQALIELARSGEIGEIRDVEACFTKLENPEGRELNSTRYAGSFYELGTYTLLPAIKLLGEPNEVSFQAIRTGQGNVDGFMKAHLVYDNAFALSKTGLTVKSEGCLIISGTKGYILASSPWWLTRHFEVRFEDVSKTRRYEYPFEGQGLRYEIEAFVTAIKNAKEGRKRVVLGLTVQESVWMAGVMEQVAK